MERVVITSYARTPIGAYLGGLKEVPVEQLAATAAKEALVRSGLEDPEAIDGCVFGHVMATPEAGNLGRLVALLVGLDHSTPGFTVNRICGSGLQAIISAAQEIWTGNAKTYIAGGAESLSRVPYYLPLHARYEPLRVGNKQLLCFNEEMMKHTQPENRYGPIYAMGETAENIARLKKISRADSDMFACHSQMKAKAAEEKGRFAKEIVPVAVKKKREIVVVERDEHPRPGTTLEALSRLKPIYTENGVVTAGSSSGMNDAAAAVIMMSETQVKKLGITPLCYVDCYAFSGVDPRLMGLGPVPAIQSILHKKKLTMEDIAVVEINEAFAAQVLGCCLDLGNYIGTPLYERLNPNGGACALGHPLGMSGARLVGTAAMELCEKGARYAIASACVGGGQGCAILIENAQCS